MLIELQRLSKPVQNRRRSSCERGNFILKSIEPGKRRRRCILFGRAISKHVNVLWTLSMDSFSKRFSFGAIRHRDLDSETTPLLLMLLALLSDPFQKIASSFQKTNISLFVSCGFIALRRFQKRDLFGLLF